MQVFKLSDLSSSKAKKDIKDTWIGDPNFMAPEIYKDNNTELMAEKYKHVVWALGVLFYFMLTG